MNSRVTLVEADERLICRVLVPTGEKHVGSSMKINEKDEFTLMVTLDLLSSSLLRPFIIFTGKFGKNLMKKWQHYEGSIVLFTQNHWMTAETNILYLKYIAELHEGRGMRVGLVYDHVPTHVGHLFCCRTVDSIAIAHKSIEKKRLNSK